MSEKSVDAFERASNLPIAKSLSSSDGAQSSPLESAISIEFDTGSLPVAQANAEKFVGLMRTKLKAELSEDAQMIILRNHIDLKDVTLKQLDRILPVRLAFRDGSIEYENKGKKQYVQITFIVVNASGATIHVGANGTSDDAEKALSKVYECLFEAAGMTQQWAEARSSLIARGYATSLVETIDGSLEKILSEKVVNALKKLFSGDSSLAPKLGVLPLDTKTGEPLKRNYTGVITLGAVELKVIRLDPASGDRHESTISIRPKTKIDAGMGRYIISTELDYQNHQDLVQTIKKALE